MKLTKEIKKKIDDHFDNMDIKEAEEKYPELFKENFEVGKYYTLKDTFGMPMYFKVTKLFDGGVFGYGIDGDLCFWTEEESQWAVQYEDEPLEVTKEEFLDKIKKYAVEILGFKSGKSYYWDDVGITHHAPKGDIKISPSNFIEALSIDGKIIYQGGKFAEVVEPKKEADNNNLICEKGIIEDWRPTMELRWLQYNSCKNDNILQQKWREVNTGTEEWREIKIE